MPHFDVAQRDGAGVVAVLFGWVGCTPRLLGKYAQTLLECGARRVYHATCPTYDVFLSPAGTRKFARETLELLAAHHADEPCVIGSFSNGGAFVYAQMLRLLHEDASAKGPRRFAHVRIAGTLFDSAPAYLTLNSGTRAFTEGIRSAWQRAVAFFVVRWIIMPLLVPFVFGARPNDSFFGTLRDDDLACATLYIYSEHDELTDAAKLDELVAQRRARHVRGADAVRTLRIGRDEALSPHVAHLLRHPARYRAAVTALLADATTFKAAPQ